MTPREYRHLAKLAALRGESLSDLVRELLRLSGSEEQANELPPPRHLRLVGGGH